MIVRWGHRLTFSNFQQESKADPFSKSRCDPDNLFSIPTFIPTIKVVFLLSTFAPPFGVSAPFQAFPIGLGFANGS